MSDKCLTLSHIMMYYELPSIKIIAVGDKPDYRRPAGVEMVAVVGAVGSSQFLPC